MASSLSLCLLHIRLKCFAVSIQSFHYFPRRKYNTLHRVAQENRAQSLKMLPTVYHSLK